LTIIIAVFSNKLLKKAKIIFSEGQPATHLGIVTSGKALLTTIGPKGDKVGLGELTPIVRQICMPWFAGRHFNIAHRGRKN